ncbi:MAG: ice-binding family protein [Nitrospirae bacterium]|nr:ice-binding family protein [Nitrospirota bacterium]
MNTYKGYSKILFLVLLLVAFGAGCGRDHNDDDNNNNDNGASSSSSAKAITAYSINGVAGTITEGTSPKTIAVTLPYGTIVTALTATFTTTGASVKVGTTVQTSGTTANNFISPPVIYTVTAGDGTTATYNVTVTVPSASAKAITAYSINGVAGTIDEAATPKTISVSMPSGTIVTALTATFTTTGASVKVGTTLQTSGTTTNDFTSSVDYTVTAADSTTATYTVTVIVAGAASAVCTGASCVNLGTAGNFVILAGTGITDVPASPITGNIGTSGITGASITVPCTDVLTGQVYTDDANFPGFTCTATDKTLAGLAVSAMGTAYTAAAGKPTPPTPVCPGAGAFDGTAVPPLAAGVYTCAVDVTIPTNFTLDGTATDVWVFQITGKLTQSSATTVFLTGGALPQNVFWQVSDVVEIGTTAHIEGVILAQTSIHMLTGSSTKGRLLAQAAVTLDTTTVTEP